ncbi:MAG: hypothetical protein JWM80_5936 [Cyanobacteria bacterium RYN_339]|nr:hypothetical protein [Cyanobacteria bacterium RYN_339]
MAIQNQPVRVKLTTVPKAGANVVREAVQEVAPKLVAAPEKAGFVKEFILGPLFTTLHVVLDHAPWLNGAMGHITGPIVKRKFNPPAGAIEPAAPAPLKASTVEDARKIMAQRFDPKAGKVVIGISGGGAETVHCFVVSGVKPDGKVMITQALAQATGPEEEYKGLGGKVEKWLDKKLGNSSKRMAGVVEENWSDYAARSHRNSVVLMELDANPAEVEKALAKLKTFVGRPYDHTMLSALRGTKADNAEMFCTEVSSWFINELAPGTIKQSDVMGWKIYQVADHMKATDVHGGPLKVLYNGQNRLDIKNLDPHPRFDAKAVVDKALQAEARGLEKVVVEEEATSIWTRIAQGLRRAVKHF